VKFVTRGLSFHRRSR